MLNKLIRKVESYGDSDVKSIKFEASVSNFIGFDKLIKSCKFRLNSNIEFDVTKGIFMSDYYIKVSGDSCKRDTLILLKVMKEYMED